MDIKDTVIEQFKFIKSYNIGDILLSTTYIILPEYYDNESDKILTHIVYSYERFIIGIDISPFYINEPYDAIKEELKDMFMFYNLNCGVALLTKEDEI